MVYKCCVPMCKSGYLSNKEKVSIFQIPATKIDLYNQIIKLPDRKLTLKDHVCEKHFVEEFIRRVDEWKNPLSRPRLTTDAVPTIFPGRSVPAFKDKLISNGKGRDDEQEKPQEEEFSSSDLVVASTSKAHTDRPELFKKIWTKKVIVKIPHASWSISRVGKAGHRYIVFLQTDLTNDDNIPVAQKKMVLERDLTFKLYIGFVPVKQLHGVAQTAPFRISSVSELEFFIKAFNSVNLCKGGSSIGSFPYALLNDAEVDLAADRWRSKNCENIVGEGIRCDPCQNMQNKLSDPIKGGKTSKIKRHESLSLLKRAHRRMRSDEFRLKKSCLELEERIKNVQEQSPNLSKELIIAQVSKLNLPPLQKQLIEASIRMPECDSETPKCFSEDWLLTCTVLSNCNPDAYSFMWKSGLFPLPSPDMIRKPGNTILAVKHPPKMILNRDETDPLD